MLDSFKRLLRLSDDAVVLDADCKRLARYELLNEINHGAFSRVYRALDKHTKEEVAIKMMPKARLKPRQKENILREAAIHKRLHHPNIVQFIDFFETVEHYYLVLELMRGGELFNRIEEVDSFTEEDARLIITQLARAIKYLHDCGIVHRDIKPENLVFGGAALAPVKLCDFGLSKIIDTGSTDTPCGTIGYLAPEVAKEQSHAFGVDIWGLGCVLYALLCGFPAFYDQSVPVLTEKVKRGMYDFPSPWWDNVSPGAKEVIRRCLMVDPARRISVNAFLAHPWVSGAGFHPTGSSFASPHGAPLRSPAVMREVDHHVVRMKDVFDVSLATQREAMDQSTTVSSAASSSASLVEKQPFMLGTVGQSAIIGKRRQQLETAIGSPRTAAGTPTPGPPKRVSSVA